MKVAVENYVYAAFVNAARVIKQFDRRRAENLLLREGVPQEVIARVVLTGSRLGLRSKPVGRNSSFVNARSPRTVEGQT